VSRECKSEFLFCCFSRDILLREVMTPPIPVGSPRESARRVSRTAPLAEPQSCASPQLAPCPRCRPGLSPAEANCSLRRPGLRSSVPCSWGLRWPKKLSKPKGAFISIFVAGPSPVPFTSDWRLFPIIAVCSSQTTGIPHKTSE